MGLRRQNTVRTDSLAGDPRERPVHRSFEAGRRAWMRVRRMFEPDRRTVVPVNRGFELVRRMFEAARRMFARVKRGFAAAVASELRADAVLSLSAPRLPLTVVSYCRAEASKRGPLQKNCVPQGVGG